MRGTTIASSSARAVTICALLEAKEAFNASHPEVFAAEDNGATPVEYVLVGLPSCLMARVASVAQNVERVVLNYFPGMWLYGY